MIKYLCVLTIIVFMVSCNIEKKKEVFQYSTLNALMNGLYDGEITVGEIKAKGNVGLGTFEGVDGEMIILDGIVYKMQYDGSIIKAADNEMSPFVNVVDFISEIEFTISDIDTISSLKNSLSAKIALNNIFVFVIKGEFKDVKARSIPKQNKPYKKLIEVSKKQRVFDLYDGPGAIVGFYFPQHISGLNMKGFHFHFISDNKIFGGHLLNCKIQSAKVEMAQYSEYNIQFPKSNEYSIMNLHVDENDIYSVERDSSDFE